MSTTENKVRRMSVPKRVLCPRCGEMAAWENNPHRPFCSERCRMIDLGAWASEDYKIPGASPPKPQDSEDP